MENVRTPRNDRICRKLCLGRGCDRMLHISLPLGLGSAIEIAKKPWIPYAPALLEIGVNMLS